MVKSKDAPQTKRNIYPKKNVRLHTVQGLYKHGFLKTFGDIFEHIPAYIVAKKANVNLDKFNELIKEPHKLSEYQLQKIADYLQIPFYDLQLLAQQK